jgi:hypothetical protein
MTEQETKDCSTKLATHVKQTAAAPDASVPGGWFIESTLLPFSRTIHQNTDRQTVQQTEHGGHRRFNAVAEVDAFVAGMTSPDNKP